MVSSQDAELRAAGRTAGAVGAGAVVAFWALVVLAQYRQPDYDAAADYVSALAATGARSPGVAVIALLSLGVAYAATAVVLDRVLGSRLGAWLMLAAAAFTGVVAFARIDCPGGAAGCDRSVAGESGMLVTGGESFGSQLHAPAVAAAYACVAIAMAVLAVRWWRCGDRRRASASAACLVASLATVPWWVWGDDPGGPQRLWLGILTAWVVLVCAVPLVERPVEGVRDAPHA